MEKGRDRYLAGGLPYRTSGSMSEERKRGDAHKAQATAPLLDSTQVVSTFAGAAFTVLDPKAVLGAGFVGENGRWSRPSGSFPAHYTHAAAAPSFNILTQSRR